MGLFGRKTKPEPAAEPPTMVCMRQAETWCWPEHLGARTEGTCVECSAPIFYEAQNEPFRKICVGCAMGLTPREEPP